MNITSKTNVKIEQSLNGDLLNITLKNDSKNYIDEVEELYFNVKENDMQKFIDNLQQAFENSKCGV